LALQSVNFKRVYFAQIETFPPFLVYAWSRLVLESQRELSDEKANHVAALEEHRERMERLENLVKKVRRLGFGRSIDVGAVNYYRLEAEYWTARAKSF
jgi:CRISPR/Cas system-associated protein Csm6